MEDRPDKAHRPSMSSAKVQKKGKEKQQGFNAKEAFKFLNILQSYGFPKVIGILSHLNLIKKAATLKELSKAFLD
ncbi:hypothetical protein AN958_12275 [Leucoagaricus sp. SymC.cos]|nr:hypothetical protein AN958_12275 [Leucoagaricus sp. SymC.cos]